MGGNDDYEYAYIPSEDSGIDLITDIRAETQAAEVNPDIDLIIASSAPTSEIKPITENNRKKVSVVSLNKTLNPIHGTDLPISLSIAYAIYCTILLCEWCMKVTPANHHINLGFYFQL